MEAVIRGAAVYAILLAIFRLSGRRSVAQMTPFDFVLLLIVAETTQQALLGDDFSITNSVILILTLFCLDIGMSFVKERIPAIALMLDGSPTVLVSDGHPDREALRKTRVSVEEILQAARQQHGLESMDQVKSVVLEIGGNLSIIPRKSE